MCSARHQSAIQKRWAILGCINLAKQLEEQCPICLKHSKEGEIHAEPLYVVKRGRQGQCHGHEEWQYHHWKAVDASRSCRKRWLSSNAGRWADEASYRYTQQYHGWSLEYCMFLDDPKTIQTTYIATRGGGNDCDIEAISY